MIKEDILNFWESFEEPIGFKLLGFIQSQNVSLGFDKNGFRSLYIDLPDGVKVNEPPYSLENLLFIVEKRNRKYLIISLRDDSFLKVFNEFIYTLLSQIAELTTVNDVVNKIVELYIVWSQFFNKEKRKSLNLKKLLGLAGELYYLDRYLDCRPNPVTVLESWEGPSGRTHDFIFADFDLEIKSKLATSNIVTISSIFQLEYDKSLRLGVVSFSLSEEEDENVPLDIALMIEAIVVKLKDRGADHMVFLNKLLQLNINYYDQPQFESIGELKFNIIGHQEYDASHGDFPRLVAANMPLAIKKVKYDIDLNLIEDFKI
ncbi:PD-(D/E)XK motif protein [Sphingobacterium sp. UME9]|uniref:PD-(D/E)XK motif protein n=1 Tax=Sphingobacterium sp. UME9 TaxID=1862316 RepID=UPI0015FF2A5B|nr:PD-(D/E)XK motif protein [Sphingobacterium sp. UME9]MBB1643055.1 hypothetical protein [Sphingobacterium sp. UME9]